MGGADLVPSSWSWEEALARAASEGFFVGQAEPVMLDAGMPAGLRRSVRVDTLRPRLASEGRWGTFTARHGYGSLPWHTDGAVADDPPRYIVLTSEIASETPTEVLSLSNGGLMLEALRDLVLYTGYLRPRYFRAVERRNDGVRVRWDPDKLVIASTAAHDRSALTPEPSGRIHWSENTVAVIDNWHCLHRRPAVPPSDLRRVLSRFYIFTR